MTLTGLPVGIELTLIVSGIIFLTTVIYKLLINQSKLRELKDHQKQHQQRIKELQKSNPEEAKKAMDDMLKLSSEQMRMTMKPMIVTLILSLVIFLPTLPLVYGDVTVVAVSNNITIDGNHYNLSLNESNLTVGSAACEIPCNDQAIGEYKWDINKEDSKLKFSRIIVSLPFYLPYFGNDFGWLAWYFILSMPLNLIFRKLLRLDL